MHIALWVLAAISFIGVFVCLLRPRHVSVEERRGTSQIPLEAIAELGVGAVEPELEDQRAPPRTPPPSSAAGEHAMSTPRQRGCERSAPSARACASATSRAWSARRRARSATTRRSACCPRRPRGPPGSHRLYTHEEVERLREVMRLKDLLGVSLDELKTLLTAEEARAEVRAQLRARGRRPRRAGASC